MFGVYGIHGLSLALCQDLNLLDIDNVCTRLFAGAVKLGS